MHDHFQLDGEYTVHLVRFEDGRHGASTGTDIWIEKRLLQHEHDCALLHEQIHIELGHEGHQSPREELRVRRLVAERLIPFERLMETSRCARSMYEWADELGVTVAVLEDRLGGFSPLEQLMIHQAIQDSREHGA